jgi:glycine amidinotransferase
MHLVNQAIQSLVLPGSAAVSCYTEWDPLEEVIVGRVDGAVVPEWHMSLAPTMPEQAHYFFKQHGGSPFSEDLIALANKDLDEFVHILKAEGVVVTRPEKFPHCNGFSSPHWTSKAGVYSAMPRDVMLVLGDEIIEAPMAWRSRYFEIFSYRTLIQTYFERGARWTSAPKPQLRDDFFIEEHATSAGDTFRSVITNAEPTFDAADFIRFGKDIVGQLSHVTNPAGVRWLRRHLEGRFNIHIVQTNDSHPMHIDATMMPLAPGKLLINPERFMDPTGLFRHWDLLPAPTPSIPDQHPLYFTSKWITMNLISLDEERVMVEENEEALIGCLRDWGFKPIPCSFRYFNTFGGSFHCATMDVRRRGRLTSYLS